MSCAGRMLPAGSEPGKVGMRTIVVGLALAGVLTAGCVRMQEFRGPDGLLWYEAQCGGGVAACYNEAAETCEGRGYVVAKSGTHTNGAVVTGNAVLASRGGELVFRCKTRSERAPRKGGAASAPAAPAVSSPEPEGG